MNTLKAALGVWERLGEPPSLWTEDLPRPMLDGARLPASPRMSAEARPFQLDLLTGIFLRRDPKAETSAWKGLLHPDLRCERTAGGSHSVWPSRRGWAQASPCYLRVSSKAKPACALGACEVVSHTHTHTHTRARAYTGFHEPECRVHCLAPDSAGR